MGERGFRAAASNFHRLRLEDDHISIKPGFFRMMPIRLILLGFGGVGIWGLANLVIEEGLTATSVFVGLLGGFLSLVAVFGGLAPWVTLRAHLDRTGLELRGKVSPIQGHVGWTRVKRIIDMAVQDGQMGTGGRSSGGVQLGPARSSWTWHVGCQLDDGTVVGLWRAQGRRSAERLVRALERISAQAVRERLPVVQAPVGVTPRGPESWPPPIPGGYPNHPSIRVQETGGSTDIALQEPPRRAARRSILLGAVLAVVGGASLAALTWHFGTLIPGEFIHVVAAIAFAIILLVGVSSASQGWILLRPVTHRINEGELQVLDHTGKVRRRHSFDVIQKLVIERGTITVVEPTKREQLFFYGRDDEGELEWALAALKHAMAQKGWSPASRRELNPEETAAPAMAT